MTWRYRVVFLFIIFLLFLVVLRLFYWQVVHAEKLSALAQAQYKQIVALTPIRGELRTSDNFPLVTNKLSYLSFINPKEVKEKEKTSQILSTVLSVDQATVSALLLKDLFWVPLKTRVSPQEKETVETFKLPGVGFEEHYVRYYPEGSMSAHLVGFVGKNALGEDKGYFGLEGFYDRRLRGKPGLGIQIQDAFGRPILAKMNEKSGAVDGRHLILTIDRSVQFMVERLLKEGIARYGAQGGMIAVMDPKTGNILAMASYPSFDPEKYQDSDPDVYRNPFISTSYEPGSTFKALIMAAALETNAVTPETRCPICSGPISIGGYEIRTWNNKYYENITMVDVIRHSDNTGMVFVAQKLGLDRLYEYLKAFRIGELTGIDLQGEVASELRPKDQWYPIDLATAGFGQGISVTPIELLSAFSSIANEGAMMEPHVVGAVETSEGKILKVPPKVIGRPISSKTARVMTEILVNAVNKGEAQWTRLKGYRIAGKTGTAQIPIAGHYDPDQTIPSFIGFAPADDPKFAVLVIYERPTTSIYGSETAAPTFFQIAKNLFLYYQIPPTE